MNQKLRQKATSSVERDFFRPLNNSNFGIDCRNNIDNCILEPLYDDLNEISYIKKFTTIFSDNTFRNLFSPFHMRGEIIHTFQSKIFALNKEDPTYQARKEYFEIRWMRSLTLSILLRNKNRSKRKLKDLDEKISDCLDSRKTRMVIEFNDRESASIKSFAIKKKKQIKVTTRFTSGKLLVFAKLSLKSFIYEVTETFCFSKENVKKINDKNKIERVEIFHILTDTDSTALKFIFISDTNT